MPSRFEVVWPKGVGFRTAPELEAKAPDRVPAKRGDIVVGELNDGWVATEEGLYLPLAGPDGQQLLKRKPDFIPWSDGGTGEGGPAIGLRPQSRETTSAGGLIAGTGRPPRGPNYAAAAAGLGGGPAGELDALHQKYDKKYGRPRGASAASPFGEMATSHEKHTAYMHEFRTALEEMNVDTRDDPYLNTYAPVGQGSRPSSQASSSRRGSGSNPVLRVGSNGTARRPSAGGKGAVTAADSGSGGVLAHCGAMLVTRSAQSGASCKWREGPANAIVPVQEWTSVKHGQEVQNKCSSGRVVDVSDRNVMCMSVLGEKAVMGSADHGLKEVNVRAGQVLRNLYTKRFGHTEWVTTVSHCPDGRIISGGMDSKLCLWNATGIACVDLTGHLGSISRIRTHAQQPLAISSGYDRTLRAWDLRAKTEVACCTGHDAPVLDFIWADDVIASGDRSGMVKVWDASRAKQVGSLRGHKGHVTAMLSLPQACTGQAGTSAIATGAQDGQIRIWDLRQKLNTFTLGAHPGGAVNELSVTLGDSPPVLVSVGADGRLLVLDPRASFNVLFEFSAITEDFIYGLLVLDDIAFTGDGRGRVVCFDVRNGQQKYSLDAGQNAIRCLGATGTSLICAGDDGNAVIFDF